MSRMKKDLYKSFVILTSLFVAGITVGIAIGYGYCVGYETLDFVKYLIDRAVLLLQSFAFVILVVVLLLRKPLTGLVEKVRDNVTDILTVAMQKNVKAQEQYKPTQESPLNKQGEQE